MSKKEKLLGAGLGVGVFGMTLLALKYALRPPTKSPLPDAISPAIFATKAQITSAGVMVYHESGSGQPLLFLHNLFVGASSYEWSKVYPQFAGEFRVIAPDWIGFGESARPEEQFTMSDYAQSLAEFIRGTFGEDPPIIVASGLGAGLAAFFASQHPELAARLILLMPTGRRDFGEQRLPLTTRAVSHAPLLNRFWYRNYQSTKTAVRAWLQRYAFRDASRISDETLDVYTTCARLPGAEYAILNLHAGGLRCDLDKRLAQLPQPLTIISTSEAATAHFQKIASRVQIVPFPAAGILAALETPEAMVEILQESLTTELRVL